MSIINTVNRLRRTLGLNDFAPKYTTSEEDLTEVELKSAFPANVEGSEEFKELIDTTDSEEIIIENIPEDMQVLEIEPTEDEMAKMNDAYDESYLQYSPEVVGFDSREQQWNTYRNVMTYIDPEDSLLDFGCGRGDFIPFFMSEYNQTPDYIGIDLNNRLINSGKALYPEANLILSDWNAIGDDISGQWVINIGSSNLRYDADTVQSNKEYTENTIRKMYQHCTKGLVIVLTSCLSDTDPGGLIDHDPGEIFNWAQTEFNNVALDHTSSKDVFCLIIYK